MSDTTIRIQKMMKYLGIQHEEVSWRHPDDPNEYQDVTILIYRVGGECSYYSCKESGHNGSSYNEFRIQLDDIPPGIHQELVSELTGRCVEKRARELRREEEERKLRDAREEMYRHIDSTID